MQWLKQDFADGVLDDSYAGWTATSSLRIQVDGANVSINSLRTETTGVVCYAGDALILTAYGPKRADMLQVGDLVHTIDSGFKPIRWIGKRPLNSDYFLENENHRPILIRAHALGPNVPEQDIRVSPQHRILIKSRIVQSVTEVPEVLVPAKALLPMDGVDIDGNCDAVTYVHFLFDEHELVIANGMVSESLYLGKMSIASLGNEAITEIEELFPELEDTSKHSQLCRVTLKYQTANKLAAQHAMNGCHLVTEESFYETAPV